MLFNLILVLLILVFAAFSQILLIKAVKFGFKIGQKPEAAVVEPIFNVPAKKHEVEMTEADKRTAQILANIDRYDGTSRGQVKVEVKK